MLVFGEPGLEKDNIASLIHFSSPHCSRPMVRQPSTAYTGSQLNPRLLLICCVPQRRLGGITFDDRLSCHSFPPHTSLLTYIG